MNRDLEGRWRARTAPFDGLTVQSEPLPATELRAAVARLLTLLPRCPELARLDDWHEHDGLTTREETVPWERLWAAVDTAEAFRTSAPDDDWVRVAWFPRSGDWYLRWSLSSDPCTFGTEDHPADGDVDLTGSGRLVGRAATALAAMGIAVGTSPAGQFFDHRWAG